MTEWCTFLKLPFWELTYFFFLNVISVAKKTKLWNLTPEGAQTLCSYVLSNVTHTVTLEAQQNTTTEITERK